MVSTQIAKRDETILSLQSELDATQQEYVTCSTELSERETEVAEMKAKIGKMELEIKELRARRESVEDKVKEGLVLNSLDVLGKELVGCTTTNCCRFHVFSSDLTFRSYINNHWQLCEQKCLLA